MNFVNSNCFVRRTSDGLWEAKKKTNKQCMVHFQKVLFSFFYEQHLHGQHFFKYRTKKKQKSRWWVKAKTSHHQTNNTPVCFFLCVSLMDILSRADFYTQSFTIFFFVLSCSPVNPFIFFFSRKLNGEIFPSEVNSSPSEGEKKQAMIRGLVGV